MDNLLMRCRMSLFDGNKCISDENFVIDNTVVFDGLREAARRAFDRLITAERSAALVQSASGRQPFDRESPAWQGNVCILVSMDTEPG